MGLNTRDIEELVDVAVGHAEQLFMEFFIRQEKVSAVSRRDPGRAVGVVDEDGTAPIIIVSVQKTSIWQFTASNSRIQYNRCPAY